MRSGAEDMVKLALPELRGEDGGWHGSRLNGEHGNTFGIGCDGRRDMSVVRLGTGVTVSKMFWWNVSMGSLVVSDGGIWVVGGMVGGRCVVGGSELGRSELGGSDLGGSDLGGSELAGSELAGSELGTSSEGMSVKEKSRPQVSVISSCGGVRRSGVAVCCVCCSVLDFLSGDAWVIVCVD